MASKEIWMIYEEWQDEFSSKTQVPYHYIKEIGDYWFDLIYGEGAKDFFEKELKGDNHNR
jgi:hypothetical protein